MQKRCSWVNLNNLLYINYHDKEWGIPVHNDKVLFEFLVLEMNQAGLSWETILKKRENYRKAFDSFDFEKISKYNSTKVNELLKNSGIIRNKLKINSVIKNAKIFMKIRDEFGSFDKYIWNFVGGKQIKNKFENISQIPTSTDISKNISKDIKKRGMSFVGPTIIYAFMQAIGIVNDHMIDCEFRI